MLKLAKKTRAQEIQNKRSECEKLVKTNRFLGQPIYIPYYWNKFLSGGGDCEDVITFLVTDEDVLFFPELKKRKKVKFMTFQSGRVVEVRP